MVQVSRLRVARQARKPAPAVMRLQQDGQGLWARTRCIRQETTERTVMVAVLLVAAEIFGGRAVVELDRRPDRGVAIGRKHRCRLNARDREDNEGEDGQERAHQRTGHGRF